MVWSVREGSLVCKIICDMLQVHLLRLLRLVISKVARVNAILIVANLLKRVHIAQNDDYRLETAL